MSTIVDTKGKVIVVHFSKDDLNLHLNPLT